MSLLKSTITLSNCHLWMVYNGKSQQQHPFFQECDLPFREFLFPPYNLFFWGKKEKKRGETNPGSLAGTRRNQEIKLEQNPFPEKRKESRETSPGTWAGTRRNQEIMMEQSLSLGRIENPMQLQSWGKKWMDWRCPQETIDFPHIFPFPGGQAAAIAKPLAQLRQSENSRSLIQNSARSIRVEVRALRQIICEK